VRVLSLATKQDQQLVQTKCRRLAVDAENIYFLGYVDPNVYRMPRSGGPAVPIANSGNNVFGSDIALDDKYVYWSVNNVGVPGGILRVDKKGGPLRAITTVQEGLTVAVDDTAIYWTHKNKPGVYVLAKPD
jgi:hypothetical protein